jgi:GntR family transcriptional regulator
MTVDHRDPEPMYLQLAGILRQQIANGEITDVLPSNRDLRQTHGVSEQVVTHAMQTLADEGLIFTVPRRGAYVTQKPTR